MIKRHFVSAVFFFAFSFFLQATNYIVSGLDYSMNGLYKQQSVLLNGKPVYVKTAARYYIAFNGTQWLIGYGDYNFPYQISFVNASTADTPPLTQWTSIYGPSTMPMPVLAIEPPTLTYSRSKFVEHYTNNAGTNDTIQIAYNKVAGDEFSGIDGDNFISAGKVQVLNVPAGMTASIIRRSDSTLLFSIKGNALNHLNADDVNDLTVRFKPEAFVGNDTMHMIGAYQKNMQVDFREVFTVGSTGADYATIKEAEVGVTSYDILELAAETFTESNINISKSLVIIGQGADKTIVQAHEQKNMATGRVFNFYYSPDTTYIKGITVRHGYLTGNGGGNFTNGAGIECNTPLEMYSCQISDNTCHIPSDASGVGAGIRANAVKLFDCLVSNNHLSNVTEFGQVWGGAIFTGSMYLVNTTVCGNYSSDVGGGLYAFNATLINCTVSGNTSNASGGGIHVEGNTTIINSIMSGNTAVNQDAADLGRSTGTLNVSNSIIKKAAMAKSAYGSSSTLSGPVFNGTVTNIITGDPMLEALANNGGPTYTFALSAGSAAIDNSASGSLTPDRDQRGYTAIGQRDVGAFEYGATAPVATSVNSSNPASLVRIYPNPSKGIFKIEGAKDNILVSNVAGGAIGGRMLENELLDLSDLQKGMYLLTVTLNENTTTVIKVVIE